MKTFFYFLLFIFSGFSVTAQKAELFKKKYFIREGKVLPYRIIYPKDYDEGKKYPVLTFLHGSGERGTDNERQLAYGGELFANDSVRNEFKAIVIFPQCPNDSLWSHFTYANDATSTTGRTFDFSFSSKPTFTVQLIKLLLDSLVATRVADPDKMYIGGLSMGGIGTFDMIQRYPDYFAAAIAICGGGDTRFARNVANHTALWIFHGDKDEVVDVNNSRQYYQALKKLGADVRYTEYPNVKHNSYDYALVDKELLPWLISKSKNKKKMNTMKPVLSSGKKKVKK